MTEPLVTSKIRGHLVYTPDFNNWFYSDDDSPYGENDRPCVKCGVCVAHDQPDPCLGWLNGVDFACCGHGDSFYEYVNTGETRYDSVEAWRLDAGCATMKATTDQQEV